MILFNRVKKIGRRFVEGLFPPLPAKGISFSLRSVSMKRANVRVSWGSSPSTDVIEYNVAVINEDTQDVLLEKTVSFAETEVLVEVEENTNITATVVAFDGTFESEPVSSSFSVGDLTAPAPVSFVGFELVSVFEVEEVEVEEDPVEVVEGGDNSDDSGDTVEPEVEAPVEPEQGPEGV